MGKSSGNPQGRGRRGAGAAGSGQAGGSSTGPDTGPGFFGGARRAAGGGPGDGAGGGRYRRAVLETSILASLAETTTHGYDLVEQIGGLASDLVCIDPGSMYRLLRELEEQGLVSSTWQTPEAGPSRRVYVITQMGIEALEVAAAALAARASAMQRLAGHAVKAAAKARADTP